MNAGQLEEQFRLLVDDCGDPPLWTPQEVLIWLNEAEVEACRRARLIVDSRSKTGANNVCRLTLVAGTAFYAIDPRVIYVRRAKLVGRNLPLTPVDYRDLDERAPGWEDHAGSITGYIRGLDSGQFRPYKIPEAADDGGFIDLIVVREPLTPMDSPDDEPEIAPRYHRNLIEWVAYRAYSKKDAETQDEDKALNHLATFEAEFGTKERASALEEEWQRNTLPFNGQDGTA